MAVTRKIRFALRRGTAAQWAAAGNPVLAEGEAGVLVDPSGPEVLKIGDGVTPFSLLSAVNPGPAGPTGPASTVPGPQGPIDPAVAASAADAAASAQSAADAAALVGAPAGVVVDAALDARYFTQADFVDLARSVSRRYTSMIFAKVATNKYQVRLDDGEKGITYQFIKDTNDDFIKLDGCYAGFGFSTSSFANIDIATDTTGTWNTGTSSYYTTTVGGTYTETLAAGPNRIELRVTQETRGGLWNVAVKNGATTVATTTVSCWGPSTVSSVLVTLATGLNPTVSYTVVCTYAGDDPAHAPSSSPSRGYIRFDAAAGSLVGTVAGAATTQTILADASNKEMAFLCNYGGVNDWVPEHDAVGSAFKIVDPTFWLNGTPTNAAAWTIGQSQVITSFRLDQKFNGRIAATNVLEFRTAHAIDSAGMLTFDGRFKVLVNGLAITGYPMMLPALQSFTNEFVSGIGTTQVNAADESNTYFTADRDKVSSGAVVSSTNRNLLGAVRLKNARLTYRQGKANKPVAGQALFVWNRATKPKMYWQPFLSTPFNTGDAYAWSFDLMVADTDNVYAMVKG